MVEKLLKIILLKVELPKFNDEISLLIKSIISSALEFVILFKILLETFLKDFTWSLSISRNFPFS